MEKKFDLHTDFEFWSKELTSEEMGKLCPSVFNEKDLTTDFEWVHYDNYVENNELVGNYHQLAFYNNHCLWQLTYIANESGEMTLQCLYSPNDEAFGYSFDEICDLLCDESVSEDSNLIECVTYKSNERKFIVGYFYIDE